MKKRITAILLTSVLMTGMFITGCESKSNGGNNKASVNKEEKQKSYVKGNLTESSFESEYLNLKYTLPENFVMSTTEEMLEMSDLGAEISEIDLKKYEYSKALLVYEMMAVDVTGTQNVMVVSEKLASSNITVDKYISGLKSQFKNLKEMDYKINEEVITKEIAGHTYSVLSMSAMGGIVLQEYHVRIEDGRAIAIIVTAPDEESKNIMLEGFSTLK